MSPRSQEQYAEIRNEKKELILSGALELFADLGYENTSISHIAKKAGISKGLLYNYYESKEKLLISILNRGIDQIIQLFDPDKDGNLEPEELVFFIHELFKNLRANRNFWRLYYQIAFQNSVFKHISAKIDELYRPLMVIMIKYFRKMGFENPDMEVMIFAAIFDGVAIDYVLKPELVPIEKMEMELIRRYCTKKERS